MQAPQSVVPAGTCLPAVDDLPYGTGSRSKVCYSITLQPAERSKRPSTSLGTWLWHSNPYCSNQKFKLVPGRVYDYSISYPDPKAKNLNHRSKIHAEALGHLPPTLKRKLKP